MYSLQRSFRERVSKFTYLNLFVTYGTRWILECSSVFRMYKDSWSHLIPNETEESPILAEHFFNTAASLMARQLRDCVTASIEEFIAFLKIYEVFNCVQSSY